MRHRLFHSLTPFVFIALGSIPAQAALLEAPSSVTQATVYPNRALVTRTARVHLPAGDHTVIIKGLPASMNERSLRVEGKAKSDVKIGAVDIKHIYLSRQTSAEERAKIAEIETKMLEKATLQAEIKALGAKEAFINRIAEAGVSSTPSSGESKIDFSPEKWQQAWGLVQKGIDEANKELAVKKLAESKVDIELDKLQAELNQIRSQKAKEQRDASIHVETGTETDLVLSLTYQANGVSWTPVYEARLDTSSGELRLEQYGSVSQVTGEDWTNVALTLSTARPSLGTEMPPTPPWIVRLFRPVERHASMDSVMESAQSFRATGGFGSNDGAPRQRLAMKSIKTSAPPPVAAIQAEAAPETTEYSAEFKVPGRVDLKSTRDKTKLHIGKTTMTSALSVQATPRLSEKGFLFAKATHEKDFPLLRGEVAKYRDGSFIGNAQLPLVRPHETVDFAFGVDDRVTIKRKQIKDKKDNPTLIVMGSMTQEQIYETKIKNLHKTPISLVLFDQIPTTNDPDIEVSILEGNTTKGFEKPRDKEPGVLSWTQTLQPQKEQVFSLGFRISYPKGRTLEGL